MPQNRNSLVWIDLEMTGLKPESERIIEIATIITDANLSILAEGPVIAISQPEELLAGMDEWNKRTHTLTGLIERVRTSGINQIEAELETLEFVQKHVPKNASPLCGNTICQDRRFLYNYMPELEQWLHYRNLDVSSIKELVKRWRPDLVGGFQKKNSHVALEDIRESIEELKYYREHFLCTDTDEDDIAD